VVAKGVSNLEALWHGFGPETKAALIGAVVTVITAAVGFGGLILQMRSQALQARQSIAENEKRRLKAAIYEDSVVICRSLSDAAINLSTQLQSAAMQLGIAVRAAASQNGFQLPTARYPRIIDSYNEFSDAALRFIFLIENRRIVDPRIAVFRTAFNVILHDARALMYSHLVPELMPSLPTEAPDGTLFPYNLPTAERVERIHILSKRFIETLNDATAYTDDFLVEMQNHLLGDLFGKEVAHRQPIDPNCKVITLAKADELERWFETSTPWGQEMTSVNDRTRDRFETR
jgi:hypothetical protein